MAESNFMTNEVTATGVNKSPKFLQNSTFVPTILVCALL